MRHLHRAIAFGLLTITANLSAQYVPPGISRYGSDKDVNTVVDPLQPPFADGKSGAPAVTGEKGGGGGGLGRPAADAGGGGNNSGPPQLLGGGRIINNNDVYGQNAAVRSADVKTEKAAFLGVSGSPLTPALREQLKLPTGVGMVIDFVESNSPAESAGLKQYDILHKLDNQLLINAHQLAVLVRLHKPGEEVSLTVIHQGQPKEIKAALIEKEVTVLDDRNPWGVPPGPWENTSGKSMVTFRPLGLPGMAGSGRSGVNGLGSGDEVGGVRWLTDAAQPQLTPSEKTESAPSFNPAQPSGMSKGETKFDTAFFSQTNGATAAVEMSDDKGTASFRQDKSGRHFFAADVRGKTLFDGPVDTEAQRKAVPSELLEKLKRMETPLRGATTPQSAAPESGTEAKWVAREFHTTEKTALPGEPTIKRPAVERR